MAGTSLKKSESLKLYSVLKVRVRETLLESRERIEREKLLAYWNTGKLINDHVRLNNGRADYAQKILLKLERDIGIDATVLRRTAQFQAAFPIRAHRRELTWTHYRALLPVKDEAERNRLAERAEHEHWDSTELRKRIRKMRYENGRLPAGIADPLVQPKAGTPGLYRIVKSGEFFAIDLGFASYVELLKNESRGLRDGAIVKWNGRTKPVLLKDAEASDLYAYPAELIRVVDGDTLWMKITLAGSLWIKEKLRLRGIDAPELSTPEGVAAKRFIISVLNQSRSITITTTKPDKWDRYLSDVFLEMPKASPSGGTDGEVIYLNNHLLENGYAIRYDRVHLEDWDREW